MEVLLNFQKYNYGWKLKAKELQKPKPKRKLCFFDGSIFLGSKQERIAARQAFWDRKCSDSKVMAQNALYFASTALSRKSYAVASIKLRKDTTWAVRGSVGLLLEIECINLFSKPIIEAFENHPNREDLSLCLFGQLLVSLPSNHFRRMDRKEKKKRAQDEPALFD